MVPHDTRQVEFAALFKIPEAPKYLKGRLQGLYIRSYHYCDLGKYPPYKVSILGVTIIVIWGSIPHISRSSCPRVAVRGSRCSCCAPVWGLAAFLLPVTSDPLHRQILYIYIYIHTHSLCLSLSLSLALSLAVTQPRVDAHSSLAPSLSLSLPLSLSHSLTLVHRVIDHAEPRTIQRIQPYPFSSMYMLASRKQKQPFGLCLAAKSPHLLETQPT